MSKSLKFIIMYHTYFVPTKISVEKIISSVAAFPQSPGPTDCDLCRSAVRDTESQLASLCCCVLENNNIGNDAPLGLTACAKKVVKKQYREESGVVSNTWCEE